MHAKVNLGFVSGSATDRAWVRFADWRSEFVGSFRCRWAVFDWRFPTAGSAERAGFLRQDEVVGGEGCWQWRAPDRRWRLGRRLADGAGAPGALRRGGLSLLSSVFGESGIG